MTFLSNLVHWLFGPWDPPIPTPPIPPVPPAPLPSITRDEVVEEINRVRTAFGRQGVEEDNALSVVSQQWSDALAVNGAMTHGDFQTRIGDLYPRCAAAENVALGAPSVREVVDMWMRDYAHRNNLLGPYTHIGVGISRSVDGTLYWVTDYVRLA